MWSSVDTFRGNRTAEALLRKRECPLCAALEHRPVFALSQFQFYSDSAEHPKRVDLQTVRCARCGLLYLNPTYSALGLSLLFAEAEQSYGASEGRALEQVEWLLKRGLLIDGGCVLDIGCYDGHFLSHVPTTMRRFGVDVDESAVKRGRKNQPDVTFISAPFELFTVSEAPELITMFHVLEHLGEPLRTLERLRQVVAPHGHLVVEVPVLEFAETNDINGFFSVQHQTHFSQRTLRDALSRTGWEIVDEQRPGPYNGYRVQAKPRTANPLKTASEKGNHWTGSALGDDLVGLQTWLSTWYAALATAEHRILTGAAEHTQVALWGAGGHSEWLYHVTSLFSVSGRRFLMVDQDPTKQGSTWRGLEVRSPAILGEIDWKNAVLLASSYRHQDAMEAQAIAMGVPRERIVKLYDHVTVY